MTTFQELLRRRVLRLDGATGTQIQRYTLTEDEKAVVHELRSAFLNNRQLQRHIAFLYEHGSMYKIYNGNLLYHGCVPMDEDGGLSRIEMFGGSYSGREYFGMAEQTARGAFYRRHKRQKRFSHIEKHLREDAEIVIRRCKR